MSKKVKGWVLWLGGLLIFTFIPAIIEAMWPHYGAAYGSVISLLWFLVIEQRYHIL